MAHYVQAGNARPKVRNPWGVVGLSIITLGFYLPYWWYRTNRDMSAFEQSAGSTRIDPRLETMLFGAWFAFVVVLQIVGAVLEPANTSIDPTTGLLVPTDPSPAYTIVQFLSVPGLVAAFYLAFRLRSNIMHCMTLGGVLPEDRPKPVLYYVLVLFTNALGMSARGQAGLNMLWNRYPKYYESIGGTQDGMHPGQPQAPAAFGAPAGFASTQPAPPSQPAPPAAPMYAQAAPPMYAAAAPAPPAPPAAPMAAMAQAHQPPPAPVVTPEQRMAELTPKASDGSITVPEAIEYAQVVQQLHGPDNAAPWYQYVTQRDPANAGANLWWGSYLLARNDEAGLEVLTRAVDDPAYGAHARQQLATWLTNQGRTAEAAQFVAA